MESRGFLWQQDNSLHFDQMKSQALPLSNSLRANVITALRLDDMNLDDISPIQVFDRVA